MYDRREDKRHYIYTYILASYCDPGVVLRVVLGQLGRCDAEKFASYAGEIEPGRAEPDPVHEAVARRQGRFVPRVACEQTRRKGEKNGPYYVSLYNSRSLRYTLFLREKWLMMGLDNKAWY